jgi:glycosyltransferase involved in cell wall biosynthesis
MANILFLYSELMPYTEVIINDCELKYGNNVVVISWDKQNKTPYKNNLNKNINYFNRSELDFNKIIQLVTEFKPDLIYISGRMDKLYLKIALHYKNKITIVTGSDNQWENTIKNKIQKIFSYFLYRRYFDYFWVAGYSQYTFARNIGYNNAKIIHNLYSGNTFLFNQIKKIENLVQNKKSIIFVGRCEKVKGLDLLIETFKELPIELKKDWSIIIYGEGTLVPKYINLEFCDFRGFKSQIEIFNETKNIDSIFCLPSRKEPWGVVVHEFASAGHPLLLSNKVGAKNELLVDGYNGYGFNIDLVDDFKNKLFLMMSFNTEERIKLGIGSNNISKKINSNISAASLNSILINISR